MLIALDYDKTYTADPVLWDAFLLHARERGHSVVCATLRFEHEGADLLSLAGKIDHLIFTGRRAKLPALRAAGLIPAIWIDDSPHWIFQDDAE